MLKGSSQQVCFYALGSSNIKVGFHTSSQSRASPSWPGSGPPVEPVCRPRRCVAAIERAEGHQGKDAAPGGGRSKTKTPGTDCELHCSERTASTGEHYSNPGDLTQAR